MKRKMMMSKLIVLLSGGLDSVVSLAKVRNKYDEVLALTFDYGQKSFESEKKAAEKIARSPFSRPYIKKFIKSNNIDMSDFKGQTYCSFQDFFSRKRKDIVPDRTPEHLISPCDGYLSAYKIKSNSSFFIKGSWYKVKDLVTDEK